MTKIESVKKMQSWVILGYLRPVFSFLKNAGLSSQPYLDVLGISSKDLEDVDLQIPYADVNQLFQLLHARLEDDNIGLTLGYDFSLPHLGMLGMLLLTCPTVDDVLQLIVRYQNLIGTALKVSITEDQGQCCFEVARTAAETPCCRQSWDYNLAAWLSIKSQLGGGDLPVTQVELPYAKPENDFLQRRIYSENISYGHAQARFWFDEVYLGASITFADASLRDSLRLAAEKKVRSLTGRKALTHPFLDRIRDIILERVHAGVPALSEVASVLGLHARTLQRQLERLGTTYLDILDLVRCELSKELIVDPQLSLTEMAMMLGFSQQSSFQRVFKRWHGMTPRQYRVKVSQAG